MTAAMQPPSAAQAAVQSVAMATTGGTVGSMKVRNGRYYDGENDYQRTSNMLKNIETDTYNLDEWKANTLAIGLAARADLVVGVAAAAQFDPVTGKLTREAKSTLKGLREQAMAAGKSKAGANAGTAVHTATERLDLGESVQQVGLPEPYATDLRAYEALKQVMGIDCRPEWIERTVRNLATGSAGTIDRAVTCRRLEELGILAPGEMIIADVKTEGDPLLNLIHIAPQLANYAFADDVWIPEPTPENEYAGRYEPMPPVSKTVGLMIHVRGGRAVPYLVNLERGWASAVAAAEQRERIKESKIRLGEPGCWAMQVDVPLPELAPTVVPRAETPTVPDARTVPVARPDCHAEHGVGHPDCPKCWHRSERNPNRVAETVEVQQAVTRPDGNVEWQPVPSEPDPTVQLLEAIYVAGDLAELARLYDLAAGAGIPWEGPVSVAGQRRQAIVTCPQRAMHDPATTSKCACSWARGLRP